MEVTTRQPTSLERLGEVINGVETEYASDLDTESQSFWEDTLAWLNWTYNFLETRKLYHKKSYVKKAILQKMAEQLLSADELEAVERQAEEKAGEILNGGGEHTDDNRG